MTSLNRNYLFTMVYKCLIIALSTLKVANCALQSPCPNVFEYRYDNTNDLFGLIQVPGGVSGDSSIIRLDIQLSVGNPVQGFNGNIELATPRSQILDILYQNRPLRYRVNFPYWVKIPPAITRIAVNDNQICYGYPIDKSLASLITTINLQHTLTVGIPSRSPGNTGQFPNFVDPESEYNYRPSVELPSINYDSQSPQDQSKMYPFNPFLNQNNRFNSYNYLTNTQHFPGHNNNNYNYPSGSQNYPFPNSNNRPQDFLHPSTSQYQPSFPRNYYNNYNYNNNNFNYDKKNNGHFFIFDEPSEAPQHPRNSFNPPVNKPGVNSNNNQNNNYFYTFEDPSVNFQHPRDQFGPSTEKPVINFTPTQKPIETDEEELPTVDTNLVQKPQSGVCGISVQTNALLVNGNGVGKGSHPWLAAIFMQNKEGLKFSCGSTLISQKHVITAAHCVKTKSKTVNPEDMWIVMGRENIQQWSSLGSQTIQAENVHVHPDYVPNKADADIAIIGLLEEATFSNLIKPICLWTGDKNSKLIVEKKGTVIGWGRDESGKLYSAEPRQFDFPVVSEETCLRSNPAFVGITSNRTFCAGYRNNTGPCNGDSGSGFLMKMNGRWTLRGVVSMSLLRDDGSCDLEQYVVYTDVVQFTDWVLSYLRR